MLEAFAIKTLGDGVCKVQCKGSTYFFVFAFVSGILADSMARGDFCQGAAPLQLKVPLF